LWRLTYYVRTAISPEAIAPEIRRTVASLDPTLPIRDIKTMRAQLGQNAFLERLLLSLTGSFAGLALLLSAIGLYGVISFSVARRTGEIGLRMALGARRTGIVWLMLRQMVVLILIGIAVGIAGALAATRIVTSMLYQVEPNDPVTIAGAVAILLAVAVLAALQPAARAAGVNPSDALRSE
jgi:ABC-type antimicrobial peptide transport system permease subunit